MRLLLSDDNNKVVLDLECPSSEVFELMHDALEEHFDDLLLELSNIGDCDSQYSDWMLNAHYRCICNQAIRLVLKIRKELAKESNK